MLDLCSTGSSPWSILAVKWTPASCPCWSQDRRQERFRPERAALAAARDAQNRRGWPTRRAAGAWGGSYTGLGACGASTRTRARTARQTGRRGRRPSWSKSSVWWRCIAIWAARACRLVTNLADLTWPDRPAGGVRAAARLNAFAPCAATTARAFSLFQPVRGRDFPLSLLKSCREGAAGVLQRARLRKANPLAPLHFNASSGRCNEPPGGSGKPRRRGAAARHRGGGLSAQPRDCHADRSGLLSFVVVRVCLLLGLVRLFGLDARSQGTERTRQAPLPTHYYY